MGSKGATTTTTSAPPQIVQDMYKYLTEQGKTLQQQQYQPYTGQLVAPLNPIQEQSIQQTQQYAQTAQPFYQGAAAGTLGAMQGYTPQAFQQGVSGYMSPYLQNAMGSTAALLANQQAQQRQELLGKTIQQGAFGGDRGKIAQAALAGQQNLASGEILSKMAQAGYSDAAQNYLKSLGAQGALASQLGTLGSAAQTAALAGSEAIGKAGSIPYAIQQAQNAANYQQFAQQQAYPFQSLGFLANIASGLGGGQGGVTSATTPGPSGLGQLVGGLTTLGSLFAFADGGAVTDEREGHAAGGSASQGGLVPAGHMREEYARGGAYGVIPYVADPLYESMAEKSDTPFGSYVPSFDILKAIANLPEATPYKDTESEYIKGLQAMPEWQRSNLKGNLAKLMSKFGYGPDSDFAEGGLVPRTAHADGQAPEGATVPAEAKKRNIFEHIMEKDFSPEAKTGLLAAGLGMLASRSPFPGVAIGEGAMGGLNTYYNALKNKMEVAKGLTEMEKTQVETSKSRYEKVWIPGKGYLVYDSMNPYGVPKQITDSNLNPIGNVRPEDIPTAPGSPEPQKPSVKTDQAPTATAQAPAAATTVPPDQKEPEAPKKTDWAPITVVPRDYMPPEHMNIMMDQTRKTAESNLANETLKVARSESQSGYDQLFRMQEMDKQFANLPDEGFLSPGAYGNERMAIAKDANTLVQVLGGKPLFDPNDVASMEALAKDTFRLGTELTRSLGANEPGRIVEAAVKANPGIENTPMAYRRIMAGLKEAAQYKRDRAAFYNNYSSKFGHLSGADELFAQLNPPQRYAERAIVGTVDPRDVAALKEYVTTNPQHAGVAKGQIDQKYGAGVADLLLGK